MKPAISMHIFRDVRFQLVIKSGTVYTIRPFESIFAGLVKIYSDGIPNNYGSLIVQMIPI